jgi:hypothetical protein
MIWGMHQRPDLGNHLYLDVGKKMRIHISMLVYEHREIALGNGKRPDDI